MRLLFVTFLAAALPAGAHIGNENNTEIRIYADSMRMVLRTSIPLAWSFLDGNAPPMADETGQAVAKPLLIAAAPGLVTVTAGGKPMLPSQVDCLFEVQNDVAFIFNFKRPAEWPVDVKLEFFPQLGGLDTGTIAVFDYTASRFARDVEPFAQRVVDRNHPSLSFSLDPPPAAAEVVVAEAVVASPHPEPAREPSRAGRIVVSCGILIGIAGIAALAYRRLNRNTPFGV